MAPWRQHSEDKGRRRCGSAREAAAAAVLAARESARATTKVAFLKKQSGAPGESARWRQNRLRRFQQCGSGVRSSWAFAWPRNGRGRLNGPSPPGNPMRAWQLAGTTPLGNAGSECCSLNAHGGEDVVTFYFKEHKQNTRHLFGRVHQSPCNRPSNGRL